MVKIKFFIWFYFFDFERINFFFCIKKFVEYL